MFEAILSSGSKSKVDYPDSGPGSKRLQFGTDKLGYFASVPVTEFFTAGELRKQLDFWAGIDNNNDAFNWVKAYYEGKVIFFPQFPFAAGLTWNQLYTAGLVYGIDGPGAYPAASGAVNQMRLVNIGSDVFKVRLFTTFVPGTNDGTWNRSSTSPIAGNSPYLSDSEWSMMCQSLIQGVSANYKGPKWLIYPSNSFLASGRTAAMKDSCSDSTYKVIASNVQIAGELKTVAGWWYPVLELIPGNERPLLPMNQVTFNNPAGSPIVTNEIIQDVGITKYRTRAAEVLFNVATPSVEDIVYDGFIKLRRTDIQVTTTNQQQPVIDEITYS